MTRDGWNVNLEDQKIAKHLPHVQAPNDFGEQGSRWKNLQFISRGTGWKSEGRNTVGDQDSLDRRIG